MITTLGQLRRLVLQEADLGRNMGLRQQTPPAEMALANAIATWAGLVDKGLFKLPELFAKALRGVQDPQKKRALQTALQKLQDGMQSLQGVADDIKAIRGN